MNLLNALIVLSPVFAVVALVRRAPGEPDPIEERHRVDDALSRRPWHVDR